MFIWMLYYQTRTKDRNRIPFSSVGCFWFFLVLPLLDDNTGRRVRILWQIQLVLVLQILWNKSTSQIVVFAFEVFSTEFRSGQWDQHPNLMEYRCYKWVIYSFLAYQWLRQMVALFLLSNLKKFNIFKESSPTWANRLPVKLKPNRASTIKLKFWSMSSLFDGKFIRNGIFIFSHCVTKSLKIGLLVRFG